MTRPAALTVFLAYLAPLCVPGPAAAQEPALGRPGVARVEVQRGRAVLLAPGAGARTLLSGRTVDLEGPGHLEIGAGARVRLAWPGRASMDLWGPASLQWSEGRTGAEEGDDDEEGGGSAPLPTWPGASLEWKLFDLAWADLEVRRGNHRVHLPGEWLLEVDGGAWHLRGLPGGPVEVRHHAGSPATLTWLGEATRARPPLTIYAGSSLRLERPPASREDGSKDARAWESPRWPWREESDTALQRAERLVLGRETTVYQGFPRGGAGATVWRGGGEGPGGSGGGGLPSPTSGQGIGGEPAPLTPLGGGPAAQRRQPQTEPHRPQAEPRRPQAGPDRPQAEPRQPQAAPHPLRIGDPAPAEESGPPTYQPRHWRGLSRGQLAGAGPVAVQRAEGIELRFFPSGRLKVLLDASATGPAWCFGPHRDYHLQPGAVLVFEKDGSPGLRFGEIQEREPVQGRPPFARLPR